MTRFVDISGLGYRDAFHAFFHQTYASDPERGADYLFQCAMSSDPKNLVWPLLARTGDTGYTRDTFVKASKIVLAEAILERES